MIDVILPTLGAVKKTSHPYTCFERLCLIPFPYRLHIVNRGRTWAEAANIGLQQTDGKNDVVIMDDDVFINASTFDFLKDESIFNAADIFGFKLLFPGGHIQHAGGIVRETNVGHIGFNEEDKGQYDVPYFVCHATTSLVYIKRRVLDSLAGMAEDIPGIQMEDVDFSFRALKAGFKIIYQPGMAIHLQSATKRMDDNFEKKLGEAIYEISRRHLSYADFLKEVQSYPKQFVPLEVVA